MKLTLWQQFSSNHSSYFTVVGEFKTPADAEAAARQLKSFFQEIIDWFNAPENSQAKADREDNDFDVVTEPEAYISQKYGIEWYDTTIDWIYDQVTGIYVVDHLVFVQPGETWQGGRPLANLLSALGGKGMVNGSTGDFGDDDEYRELNFRITCHAPDEQTAKTIVDMVNAHTAKVSEEMRSGQPGMSMFDTPWKAYTYSLFETGTFFTGEFRAEGRHITIENVSFHRTGQGVPPMIAWLKAQGCADFRYELEEIIEDDDDEDDS